MSENGNKPDDESLMNEPNQDVIDAESTRLLREQLAARQAAPGQIKEANREHASMRSLFDFYSYGCWLCRRG